MPHALIVDDSKTARYALRQLLDKHQFSVDMVESAEQALDYLRDEIPDVIFMDHMMPGMDGFQAVKAIKSNPTTTAIPIVMYTSTQSGVYFGQARALGAADVIAKPATADDLDAVLQRLQDHHLLGQSKASAAAAAVADATRPEPAPAPDYEYTLDEPEPVTPPPPRPHEPVAAEAAELPPPARPLWPYWLSALAVIALAAVLIGLYYPAVQQRDQLLEQQRAAFKAIEWAVNQAPEYPYGEQPFGGPRLLRLQNLVEQLKSAGFRGTVRLESHSGEFCLLHLPAARGQQSLWIVAPEELPLTDCSALGQSAEQAQKQSELQSQAFRRFLKELPVTAAGIRVDVVALGAREPLVDYPTSPIVSAGEWNRVAQRNQRIHTVLEPEAR